MPGLLTEARLLEPLASTFPYSGDRTPTMYKTTLYITAWFGLDIKLRSPKVGALRHRAIA
ncbi:MAG: hypothetical protein SAL70_36935 [Scytonema sp. PMC 1070.18]|nr:hypothetical protein [Scytonema sp. PMC 1070.18]